MPNKKNLILIGVIIVALGAAAFVLFRGFGGKSATLPPQLAALGTSSGQSSVPNAILPKGTDLNFAKIKKYNPDGKLFSYPSVVPEEVGVDVGTMIKQKSP